MKKITLRTYTFTLNFSLILSDGAIGEVLESADVRMTKAMHSVKKRMDGTGSMALEGFESLVASNQMVLFPCFKLHQQLRNNIVGEQFWSQLQGQRRSLRTVRVKGKEIQIKDPFDSREVIRALFWEGIVFKKMV